MEFKKSKSKKAVIGATMTWLGAIFVITLILVLYLVIVFLIAEKRTVTGGVEVNVERDYVHDPALVQSFFGFLNSKVEFKGKKQKISNSIISSLDAYFETKNENGKNILEAYGYSGIFYDIINKPRDEFELKGFKGEDRENIIEDNRKLGLLLQSQLNKICSEYYLSIPQFMVAPEASMGAKDERLFANSDDMLAKYSPSISYTIMHRSEKIEIKFRVLKECLGGYLEYE